MIVKMEGIGKTFQPGNIIANEDISLELEQGKIHAIVGENGAGKTTLMKILYGEECPDSGRIFIRNKEVKISNPLAANRLGLGMAHQEFQLFPSLTAAQNIVLGVEPKKAGLFYDRNKADSIIRDLSIKYSLKIDPKMQVSKMTIGQKQCVEILKMLYRGAHILILDEPTAVLVKQEVNALFKTLKALAETGHTIIFITHKLGEVKAVANSVFVMKSGKMIACRDINSVTEEDICYLMVGRKSGSSVEKQACQPGEVVLKVDNLSILEKDSKLPVIDMINLQIRKGEIFGIAGVAGNGQSDLLDALFGLKRISSGEVFINGLKISGSRPGEIRSHGVAYVPAERTARGSAGQAKLWENLIVYDTVRFRKKMFLDMPVINSFCDEKVRSYAIKAGHNNMRVSTLSGGNLQKLVLSRELDGNIKFLIIEEPARGLDVSSADFVYSRILDMRQKGCAILLVSSDLSEIITLSDFIGVMYKGRITKVFENVGELSVYEIGEYMMGIKTGVVGN